MEIKAVNKEIVETNQKYEFFFLAAIFLTN